MLRFTSFSKDASLDKTTLELIVYECLQSKRKDTGTNILFFFRP